MLYGAEEPPLVVPQIITGYERIKALKRQLRRQGLKRNIPDLLALAEANDPFYAGSPAQTDQAQWFLALWNTFGFTRGVHLRRIHYRIVSVEVPYKKADGLISGCRGEAEKSSSPRATNIREPQAYFLRDAAQTPMFSLAEAVLALASEAPEEA